METGYGLVAVHTPAGCTFVCRSDPVDAIPRRCGPLHTGDLPSNGDWSFQTFSVLSSGSARSHVLPGGCVSRGALAPNTGIHFIQRSIRRGSDGIRRNVDCCLGGLLEWRQLRHSCCVTLIERARCKHFLRILWNWWRYRKGLSFRSIKNREEQIWSLQFCQY